MRELKPSQFTRDYSPDSYTHLKYNHQGTFGNSKDSNKVVTMIATDANPPPKCIVYLLDYYFKRLSKPPESIEFFFVKPFEKKFSDIGAPYSFILFQ